MDESGVSAEFRGLVVQLGETRRQSLNSLFGSSDAWGNITTSWVKDRYYGRTKITRSDCDKMHGILAPTGVLPRVVSDLSVHKDAVAQMCNECVGVGNLCWDAGCPLRPVSPLALKKR